MPIDKIQTDTLRILAELLPAGSTVALLDFPNHKNAGDHLIWEGEIQYIRDLGLKLAYVADATRYSKADLDHFIGPDGIVLIHGGGNFGDRWDEAQAFHERIVDENHDRHVIQLSQGIEFQDGPRLERAQSVYGAHPNLTILIRDHVGFDDASRRFGKNDVRFCPDMAFGNKPIHGERGFTDVIYLKRTDSESVNASVVVVAPSIGHLVDDWGLTPVGELLWIIYHVPGAVARRLPFTRRALFPIQARCYQAIARLNLRSAKRILGRGGIVLTDRLHAAVLGALMGKPVVALDNANGKVSAIIRDYLGTFPNVQYAPTAADANRIMSELLD